MDSDGDIESATVSTDANAEGAANALGMTFGYCYPVHLHPHFSIVPENVQVILDHFRTQDR